MVESAKEKKVRRRKRAMEPYAHLYATIEKLVAAETAGRLKMLAKIDKDGIITQTNCWWATYRASRVIAAMAREELQVRAYRKKKNARTKNK